MKKERFSEAQILKILKQQEDGIPADQLTRENGISKATLYRWKEKYGGMQLSEVKRLKQLEEENRKLKEMYAEVSLQNKALKDLLEKK